MTNQISTELIEDFDSISVITKKDIENFVKDNLSRPFGRKLQYIYNVDFERCVVLSNVLETDFKYCEADHATGLVLMHDQDQVMIYDKFLEYLKIDKHVKGTIYLNRIMSILNKVNWDFTSLTIDVDINGSVFYTYSIPSENDAELPDIKRIMIFSPIGNHYAFVQQEEMAHQYLAVMQPEPDYKYVDIDAAALMSIDDTCLTKANLISYKYKPFSIVMYRGLDLLDDKLKNCKIRIWSVSNRGLNYGSYCHTGRISYYAILDNLYLIPIEVKTR